MSRYPGQPKQSAALIKMSDSHTLSPLKSLGNRQWLAEQLTAYSFLLPALLAFALFSWYPILKGFVISVHHITLGGEMEWAGLENFRFVFSDPLFPLAWRNTLYFVVLGLLIGFPIPILLALLINEVRHGQALFRVGYYLPSTLPLVVVVLLWKWLYDPGVGLLNAVLQRLGVPPSLWYQDPGLAMPSLVFVSTWTYAGSTGLIYLAALQGIPDHLYEAAEIDGAGFFDLVRYITLPQLRRVTLIVLILQIIGTMQVFTEPFVMTGGGPNNATLTVMLLVYRYAFSYSNYGAAVALGLILFLVLVVFSVIYFLVIQKIQDADE